MEPKKEYHDPDYPEVTAPVREEVRVPSEEEKIEKIRSIIRREFSNELGAREDEVMTIEQRMSTSRRMLHRLRYAVVSNYYNEQKLMLSNSHIDDDIAAQHEPRARAEISSLLREGQRRLHPSVRKLIGKKSVDLSEIFKSRELRNKERKDYSAMLQCRNYTISADSTKSLRPSKLEEVTEPEVTDEPSTSQVKKVPRHIEPREENVLTIDEATRNEMKRRYRLIVGNTSKYAPPASRADRSTHKWLLYVRGPEANPDPSAYLTHVVARLHHSYAPHHVVNVSKPPFHINRRGWGEFPAKLELHFPLPKVNRPADIEHTIKLDRHYTGVQTLGSETIIEVWLYSTPEMLPYEYTDPIPEPLGPPDPGDGTTGVTEDTGVTLNTGVTVETGVTEETGVIEETGVTLGTGVTVGTGVYGGVTDLMQVKEETIEYDSHDQSESWMEFFSKDSTELDVDEMIIKPVKNEIVEEKSDMECEDESNNLNNTEDLNIKKELDIGETEIQPASNLKRIMKYIDSTTGKIYYLEMDRSLDLTKVQEIVINNTKAKISPIKSNGLKTFRKKKGGVSLLKPEVKNQLKCDNKDKETVKNNFNHIENDHCYISSNWMEKTSEVIKKSEKSHYVTLCEVMGRFSCVRAAVNYLLKHIPVITDKARDVDYVKDFPFAMDCEERFWKLDFAKRRNIEWSRAKLITRLISEFSNAPTVWRTKQVLMYSRTHGHQPKRPETAPAPTRKDDWSSWNDLYNFRKLESNIKEFYPNASDISSLTLFNAEDYLNTTLESIDTTLSDEDVEILSSDVTPVVKQEVTQHADGLTVLPVESEEDRLRFMFVERKCAEIGVELRNEDVGNGYSYSAVHAVLVSAMKSFAEELVRSALAQRTIEENPGNPPPTWISWSRVPLSCAHVYRGISTSRARVLSAAQRATRKQHTEDKL